jgi:putative oxidoreductase
MKKFIASYLSFSEPARDVVIFLIRITLAYGLFYPAINKWNDIGAIAGWFDHLGIPAPTLNAYMAATVEMAGVILLPLGLFTRVISFMLVFVMLVAIFSVHINNGFASGKNGFEIPLYYLLFFLYLHFNGSGKWSADHLLFKNKNA